MTSGLDGKSLRSSLQDLRREIAGADNGRLARIVRLVDAMPQRGMADNLIAPVRGRIGALRPPRPLRLSRLLFLPLRPLIVGVAAWRRDTFTIPRSVIASMTAAIEAGLGDQHSAVKQAIADLRAEDAERVAIVGRWLWPEASRILHHADPPPVWLETGLRPAMFQPLARRIAAVLAEAPGLDGLYAETGEGLLPPQRETIDRMMQRALDGPPEVLPMLATVLLDRMPEAAGILHDGRTGRTAALVRIAARQAADLLLTNLLEAAAAGCLLASATLAEAATMARRHVKLLRELDRPDAPLARRRLVHDLRRRLDDDCQRRFRAELNEAVLRRLRTLPAWRDITAITALETAARALRGLESEARVIGGGAGYDAWLSQAAGSVSGYADEAGLLLVDRVRLVEILAGSAAALEVLG